MSINLLNGKNVLTEGCVSEGAFGHPHVTNVFIIIRLVKSEVLEFIRPGGTNKWIVLGESCQDFI